MGTYSLQGKCALITGGGRGIGRAVALALAEEGARVAVAARTESEIEDVAMSIWNNGGDALAIQADMADATSIHAMVDAANRKFGGVDILVNNAAMFHLRSNVVDLMLDDWNRMLAVNLTGYFLAAQAVLPGMIQRQSGTIVMVSSTSGKRGDAGGAAYSASKFGVMGLAHALLYEVRRYNIRVHTVCPSLVDTTSDPAQAPPEGKGTHMQAVDVADAIVATLKLPPRTMVRDIELWGTNP